MEYHLNLSDIPYSAKFWRGKTLANRYTIGVGEENFGNLLP